MPLAPLKEIHHCHEVLGVPCSASLDEIKVAYKKQALIWHPDHHSGNKGPATDRFVQITEAYRILCGSNGAWHHIHDLDIVTRSTHPSCKHAGSPPNQRPKLRSSDSSLKNSFIPVTPSPSTDSDSGISMNSIILPKRPSMFELRKSDSVSPQPSSKSQKHRPPKPPDPGYLNLNLACEGRHQLHNRVPSTSSGRVQSPHIHLPAYGPPLTSVGFGSSREWKYSLPLTLEELFHGKHCCFRIIRHELSGATKHVLLNIKVPPGCQPGTRVVCPGAGHERRDGSFQDIVFVIAQIPHNKYDRQGDDLVMDISIPYTGETREQGGKLTLRGIDRESIEVKIDLSGTRARRGTSVVGGGGMPIRRNGMVGGRGNLVIRWHVESPRKSVWSNFRNVLRWPMHG